MSDKRFGFINPEGYNTENDQYAEFEQAVYGRFDLLNNADTKLFTTNAGDLYELYLANLPQIARQTYVCNTCRHFFNRYGNLVLINQNGELSSPIWDVDEAPAFFKPAVEALHRRVVSSKVTGVFYSEQAKLGTPQTGEWSHLHVELDPMQVRRDRLHTAEQLMAEKQQDYLHIIRALQDYPLDTIEQAVALIHSEALYRSDRVLGPIQWFKGIAEAIEQAPNSRLGTNLVWLAIANAAPGFAHIRSSMVGTLLEDIQSGYSASTVASRFAQKMNPGNYMRAQSAPTQNGILEAEKLVAKLGLENSLQRRYATFEEIPEFFWQSKPFTLAPESKSATSSVFGHLNAKDKPATPKFDLPTTVMTWDKFVRTVLPTATKLEALTDNANRFMALVTAADETAPNILQWDNSFSWYYHGGIDAEIKRRVESAGGRHENNEIRVSLIWEGHTDLDLHAITPWGEHISFSDKQDRSGGRLDIDQNGGGPTTLTPVENIRWTTNAPEGLYRFFVHNYKQRGAGPVPFIVELEINGQVSQYYGAAGLTGFRETVFEFNYVRGQQPKMLGAKTYGVADNWNVPTGSFVEVNGIVSSPNLWGNTPAPQAGTHMFFLLEGVQDKSEGKGRGFFNETLKSELRPIRKTLELFTADAAIQGADEATACGLGYSTDSEWNLTLKVTSGNSSRLVKIDRWD